MRKLLFLVIIALYTTSIVKAQAPGCPNVDAGPDQSISCSGTVQLTATALHTGLTNTYVASTIPYAPPYAYNQGNPILVNIDDRWSGVIPLPFNFCFYGNMYNQIVVGSNGVVTFDPSVAGGTCSWSFTASCPSPSLHKNAIFGPFHDIDPYVGGSMFQAVLGSYPCRTFVVNWYQIPMYSGSCNSMLATHQVVIYESTNVIEVYMQSKPLCPSWNNGNAVVGIQNSAGTTGLAAPGRNTSQWTATNEAWRFTPNGVPNYTISWYQGPTLISTNPTISVSPLDTTVYTAVCVYEHCDGTQVTVTDDVTVFVTNPINLVVNPTSETICQGESVTISASGAYSYAWTPTTNLTYISDSVVVVTPPTSTTYTLIVSDPLGLCTGSVDIPITVNPPPNIEIFAIPANICEGDTSQLVVTNVDSFVWNDATTDNPKVVSPSATTTYTVTGHDAFGCSNTASITVNVSAIPVITFTPPNPSICEGEAASVTASGAAFYMWNNSTTSNPLVVSPAATTSYQVTGTDNTGVCSSSAEVIVTVNESPEALFSAIPEAGCSPLIVAFTDESIGATIWNWNFGGQGTSSAKNPTNTFNGEGTYDVTLIVTSAEGCLDTVTKSDFVEVYPQPIADFHTVPEIGKVYAPTVMFFSNTIAQYWFWDFGDMTNSTSPPVLEHTYPALEAEYEVELLVSNDYGCRDSITKTVIIIDDVLIFPNIITPNGDGLNDVLVITNADKYPSNLLQVFNRWGKRVFEMKDYNNSWGGDNLADGTYYYIFKYLDQSYNGTLTILRE